jgi:hypothetical protein
MSDEKVAHEVQEVFRKPSASSTQDEELNGLSVSANPVASPPAMCRAIIC